MQRRTADSLQTVCFQLILVAERVGGRVGEAVALRVRVIPGWVAQDLPPDDLRRTRGKIEAAARLDDGHPATATRRRRGEQASNQTRADDDQIVVLSGAHGYTAPGSTISCQSPPTPGQRE